MTLVRAAARDPEALARFCEEAIEAGAELAVPEEATSAV
jgi:hypothetical protein